MNMNYKIYYKMFLLSKTNKNIDGDLVYILQYEQYINLLK